jgi:hypothetical protein
MHKYHHNQLHTTTGISCMHTVRTTFPMYYILHDQLCTILDCTAHILLQRGLHSLHTIMLYHRWSTCYCIVSWTHELSYKYKVESAHWHILRTYFCITEKAQRRLVLHSPHSTIKYTVTITYHCKSQNCCCIRISPSGWQVIPATAFASKEQPSTLT